MNEKELKFCEQYESKVTEFNMLDSLKEELTLKGLESYNKIKLWLAENLNEYMELTNLTSIDRLP